jgi:hypothetical protein
MQKNDEAARVVGGSDTDGRADKTSGLPLAVVGLHVNLSAFSHSEMAFDENRFAGNSALRIGALFKLNFNGYFHLCSDVNESLRVESGLKSTVVRIFLNDKASAREQML